MWPNPFPEHLIKFTEETLNPLTTNVPHHIETSQLISIANQLTGFYMIENIGRLWVNGKLFMHW